MGRTINKFTAGPAGVCDHCGRFCCTLNQAEIPCYHCGKGTFVHRREWTFQPCPMCRDSTYCDSCHNTGIAAIRKRSVLQDDVGHDGHDDERQ